MYYEYAKQLSDVIVHAAACQKKTKSVDISNHKKLYWMTLSQWSTSMVGESESLSRKIFHNIFFRLFSGRQFRGAKPGPKRGKMKNRGMLRGTTVYRPGQMYECDQCEYKTQVKYRMQRHQRIHNGDFIYCNHCPSRFTEPCRLLAHVRLRHGGQVVKCELCGAVFPSDDALNDHNMLQHARVLTFCSPRKPKPP
ncbi:zinc finger protein interacting with ribonucleoprotein K-like [Ylistrum balloti]|uniref:zinc finger protein interacting with ribonucleoprotein K-like n=1 Tax=Ylistrum balloti TaxID=509963 RepID=UPI002905A0BF|nr:zinc finger protein interacting with ribonucleoprotein K-like [Ylistrum balloti]